MGRKSRYFIAPDATFSEKSITMKRSLSGLPVLFKTIINGEAKNRLFCGTQTVIDDNPKLDIRDWTGNNPIRLVLIKISASQKQQCIYNPKTIILQTTGVLNKEKNPLILLILEKHCTTN
jgi:hypothetical protein